jgi:predicted transcriptional regulator
MPVFMIERTFAEQLQISPEGAAAVNKINEDVGVSWLVSFLSADKKKTYCLYEASNAEAIREAARRAGLPVDDIVEVGELSSLGHLGLVRKARFSEALSAPG